MQENVRIKIDKLLEEAKQAKPSAIELQKAAGGDFVYTSNPKETIFSMLHPIKADAISADDLEHRAKVLGIDKDVLERNMSIRDGETSGYTVDKAKLSGYASRMHPNEVGFGNTVGNGKHIATSMILPTLAIAAYGAARTQSPEGAGIGALIGGGLGALGVGGNYIGHKQGQALYDRLNKKK